jgi:alpha-L-fucosidase 2
MKSKKANGENPNPLNTIYGKPPYQKDANARLVEVEKQNGYVIDFNTEKGKTYTLVPL